MKKVLCLLTIILWYSGNAQDSETFTRDKEFYIRGNSAIVGNNILSKDRKKPFNTVEQVNDEFKMKYVDVDDSSETFSSSSAFLDINPTATIVYAALYWSATYRGDRSMKRLKNSREYHKVLEERSKDPQAVRLKIASGPYYDVRGSLIYDGENATQVTLKDRAPYACMADVTTFLKNHESGYITVANVAGTEGEILGGSSAGWLLYVVYEDEAEPLQYISTYQGFEFVNKKAVQIEFGNFKTPDSGEVETSITIGALEGDSKLQRDEVAIYDPKDATYITLDNTVRASSNFFNSTITIDDAIFEKRIPNSLNTLGFDVAKIKIPNAQNAIIANNATGVKLQYKTRSDRFFVFFTAFQTTISDTNYEENNGFALTKARNSGSSPKYKAPTQSTPQQRESAKNIRTSETVTIKRTSTVSTAEIKSPTTTPKKVIVNQKVEVAVPKASVNPTKAVVYQPENIIDKELDKLLKATSVTIDNVGPGYYIIAGVYAEISNAKNWISQLKSRGLEAQMFYRSSKDLYYVFLEGSRDASQMTENLAKIRTKSNLKSSWIMKVNL